ncbi:anti-sigma 24 factor [Zoogloea oleivorans]|uniref:Anti-sigma 24 factor n=1 Tax=Zoogloea oleivorans TaxID=1552750 RepID=A0A6C2D8C0_9RHOO|nr:sigma-E factor negative regulatory protein [Zoogloea oleivorans]TYC62043.1 anti-sigma 24 factor [Zoogloea oleivorans]
MKEKVSALLDGALEEQVSSRMLESLKRDGALRQKWESYCLIGDVLRDEQVLSSDFTSKVMLCLEDEPTVLAPVKREASGGWVRHFMPIAASVMGVAAVGWVAMALNGADPQNLLVARAKTPAVAVAAVDPSRIARVAAVSAEPSEREYLFAHQAMAPSAAMPGVALYVRTVSDSRVAGER